MGVEVKFCGEWVKMYFKNENFIMLELVCGWGEYIVVLVGCFLECNFVGVDVKGVCIWKGVCIVLEKELYNVVFFCIRIE